MHAAPSVLLFTVTAGLGQGLFFWLGLQTLGLTPWLNTNLSPATQALGGGLAFVLLALGLVASFFHLGHPERAWRAAAMWRSSWLSREVIVLPVTMAVVAAWAFAAGQSSPWVTALAALGVVLTLVLWVCTAMIYACLKFLREWAHPLTIVNYTALGLANGALALHVLSLWANGASPWATSAIVLTLLAAALRLLAVWRNARLTPRSTLQSALGIPNPKLRQISQGAAAHTFNNREFFHGKSAAFVRGTAFFALGAGAVLPVVLLAISQQALVATLALLAQYLGLLAERWLFFAEAKHPQNLYYQRVA